MGYFKNFQYLLNNTKIGDNRLLKNPKKFSKTFGGKPCIHSRLTHVLLVCNITFAFKDLGKNLFFKKNLILIVKLTLNRIFNV